MRKLSDNIMSCLERHRSVLIEIRQKKVEEKQRIEAKKEEQISTYITKCYGDIRNNFDHQIEDVNTPECGYFRSTFRLDSQFCEPPERNEKNIQLLDKISSILECHYNNIPGIRFTTKIIGHTIESKLTILV